MGGIAIKELATDSAGVCSIPFPGAFDREFESYVNDGLIVEAN